MRAGMNAVVTQIGDLAEAGEKMVERLRRKAFLPDSRKELNIRFGIAEAAQLLGCSTNRIRMAEEDGRLPPAPPTENGRRPGYKVEELLNMRQVLGAKSEEHTSELQSLMRIPYAVFSLKNKIINTT